MSVTPVLNYHIVPARGVRDSLVISPGNPASARNLSAQSIVRASEVDLAFRFYKDTDAGALESMDYGQVLVYFTARKRSPNSGEELFRAGPCARGSDAAGVYYSAKAVLNTQAIADALWNDESIQILCEVHVEGGAEASRFKPAQFEATLYNNVLVASAPPPSELPSWPAPDTVNAAVAAALAARDEALAAVQSLQSIIASITFQGDQLVVAGQTSPHLSGYFTGTSGVVALSGDITLPLDGSVNAKTYTYSGSTPIIITIPEGLAAGTVFNVIQLGSGQVTFASSGAMTLSNSFGHTKTRGAGGAFAGVLVHSENAAVSFGDMTA